ncbi:MAG: hypothetical protein IT318_20315 [Anaerolineales bacterium]|nr:hypothetical protein [Anaerolineales bacterium]
MVIAVNGDVLCEACNKPIAALFGGHLVIDRGETYAEFAGGDVMIQCHRRVLDGGRYRTCGHRNRLRLG